jgi:hypothetical protein
MKPETGGRVGEGIGRALWWSFLGFWFTLLLLGIVGELSLKMGIDTNDMPPIFGIGCVLAVSFLCGTLGFWITMARTIESSDRFASEQPADDVRSSAQATPKERLT